ncbi:unnamed protein product [Rhizophagus irregularis]|nr:unnamed protein product [Rhizophagus irregularis]
MYRHSGHGIFDILNTLNQLYLKKRKISRSDCNNIDQFPPSIFFNFNFMYLIFIYFSFLTLTKAGLFGLLGLLGLSFRKFFI